MKNFKEYILLAKRTESEAIEASLKLKNKSVKRMMHAALGLITEVIELFEGITHKNIKNIKEEFGDVFWYLAIAYDASFDGFEYKIVLPNYPEEDNFWRSLGIPEIKELLLINIKEYVDIVHRIIFYDQYCVDGEELNKVLYKIYNSIIWAINGIMGIRKDAPNKIRVIEILEANLLKLDKRYGSSFSVKGALCRDIEKELSHIKED